MANELILADNHFDNTYRTVVIGGGSWEENLSVTNLADSALSQVARSTGVAETDTTFDVDFGDNISTNAFVLIPTKGSMTQSGTYRLRGSSEPKFTGATVNAGATAGASSFSLLAGASDVALVAGEIFRFAGHTQTYKVTSDVTIASGNNASVSISPNLTDDISSSEVITCHSGDFSSPIYDSGSLSVSPVIYEFGSLPWGHPSWWTGELTPEQWGREVVPLINVFDLIGARYWRVDIVDTSNSNGYIELARGFCAFGFSPEPGVDYGAEINFTTDTAVDTTFSSARIYDEQPVLRTQRIPMSYMLQSDALANVYEMFTVNGLSKQMFYIQDYTDPFFLHRRSFLCNIRALGKLRYVSFNRHNTALDLIEVIA